MFKIFLLTTVLLFNCLTAFSDVDLVKENEALSAMVLDKNKETRYLKSQIEELNMKIAKMEALAEFGDIVACEKRSTQFEDELKNCNASLWRQRQILNEWDACYPSGSNGIGRGITPCEQP